ncbi:MAG: ATP-dependent helicase [Clostridiales bacterium]|nr:ATP-dependent helicase [Clostridiales bacterium]
MGFSKAQDRAIAHRDGPAMVLAGPGSGKTLVITQRTRYLIEEYGINPREILVITFTKAAAQEMQARFSAVCPKGGVTFGTFHAVFFGILKNAYHFTSANIMSEDAKTKMLRSLLLKYGSVSAQGYGVRADAEQESVMELAAEISMVKNERIPLEHYYSRSCPEEVFRLICRDYEQMHRQEGLLDFDDMLTCTWELLTQRADILHAWQERWHYILVDEFQDINLLQYEIIKLLAAPRDNLFIVGDDDQSIYRFRGAKPEIMLNFPKDYPKAETILLDQNFRSTKAVVEGASRVIRKNTHRFSKNIRPFREDGVPIEIREFQDQDHESLYLVKTIRERMEAGVPYRDFAILVRTNQGAGPFAERFLEFDIPFVMRESMPGVYDHWIAKDIFAYLHLAYEGPDRTEFLQIMNRPKRYISRDAVAAASRHISLPPDVSRPDFASAQRDAYQISFDALKAFYQDKDWMQDRLIRLEADLKLLPSLKPFAAINYIRYGMQYGEFLREYAAARRIKPEELMDVLDELQQSAKPYSTLTEWYTHIEEYRAALEENRKNTKQKDAEAVTIATFHASKGLEYPEVFLPDINEGILPHHRAALEADLEEERRLLYVGMTRAKDRLHLFYIKERYGKVMEPSGFLDDLLP